MAREEQLWIAFRGIDSRDVGVRVQALGEPDSPAPRGTLRDIPGRDGALWLPEGGSGMVEVSVRLRLLPGTDRGRVSEWLRGAGQLVLGDSLEYAWRAWALGGVRFRRDEYGPGSLAAEVTFTCFPFRQKVDEEALVFREAALFPGEGSEASQPLVTIYAKGDVDLMINDRTVLVEGVNGLATVDCEAMMAFDQSGANISPWVTLLSDTDDEWPVLRPEGEADNMISWSVKNGEVVSVTVQPRWRYR